MRQTEGHVATKAARRDTTVGYAFSVGLVLCAVLSLSFTADVPVRADELSQGSKTIDPLLPSFVPDDRILSFSRRGGADAGSEDSIDVSNRAGRRILPTAASPDLPAPASQRDRRVGDKNNARTAALPRDLSIGDPMVAPVPPAGPPRNDPIPDIIAAKNLFGAAKVSSPLRPEVVGSYAKGCFAGGEKLSDSGSAWQTMRLSRNRHWGHPRLIALVKQLGQDAKAKDGWPGLLVGDISQPRGGPMLTGHRSHQVGLDADIWLTPMPDRKLSRRERERISAISMLDKTDIAVDERKFTDKHAALIKRASLYPDVERIFVHPAIKLALCQWAGEDRGWLGKVRPIPGHHYHFHIRMKCPPGSPYCKPQKAPTGEDGCGKEVRDWIARVTPYKGPPLPKRKGRKKKERREIVMSDMPEQCTAILEAGPNGIPVPAPPRPTKLIPIAEDRSPYAKSPSLSPHLRRLQSDKQARK